MSLPELTISEHVDLAPMTSWRIGGPARYLASVRSPAGVVQAIAFADQHHLPVWILGGGSNMLISSHGLPGVVIRMRDTSMQIDVQSDAARITIGAGAPMAGSVRQLSNAGWAGLTWAEGLPGTFGGAVYGNAGCYGGDMAQSVAQVQLWQDGVLVSCPPDTLAFAYRTSAIKRQNAPCMRDGMHVGEIGPIVVAATVELVRDDPNRLSAAMAQTAALRRSKTPQGSSCGSVFKNPPNDSAGRLIEAVGLKGYGHGGAMIAEKHANYIVNHGGATSADVRAIVSHVHTVVLREFGVSLEPEVQLLGESW
ncbi:MAG: UDP-N-acetylmuramate dehydrogenase [Chloroflexota bacterium]|jgi:UDP-N-acetylmuramate dehydrogenase